MTRRYGDVVPSVLLGLSKTSCLCPSRHPALGGDGYARSTSVNVHVIHPIRGTNLTEPNELSPTSPTAPDSKNQINQIKMDPGLERHRATTMCLKAIAERIFEH